MNHIETVASYNLQFTHDEVVDDPARPFDAEAYSRMKYGDRAATESFAAGIAEDIAAAVPELTEDKSAPEFLVAYKAVPPACYHLSRYCLHKLNEQRVDAGLQPGRIVQIQKDRVTATDYAAASTESRQRELASIGFTLGSYSITGKPAVILDDIRITGAAESRIIDALGSEDPKLLALGYVAVFDPEQAAANPGVENRLNTTAIRHIEQLLPAIEEDNFDLNIRTLKLILSEGQREGRPEFLRQAPRRLLYDIYEGAIGSGPDFVQAYRVGVADVKTELESRAATGAYS